MADIAGLSLEEIRSVAEVVIPIIGVVLALHQLNRRTIVENRMQSQERHVELLKRLDHYDECLDELRNDIRIENKAFADKNAVEMEMSRVRAMQEADMQGVNRVIERMNSIIFDNTTKIAELRARQEINIHRINAILKAPSSE